MSLYRVHFKWKEKDVTICAKSLDLTHPYFVSMKDLLFPKETRLIIDPGEDEIRKQFADANHIMIPFQTVSLIEEMSDETAQKKIRAFTLVEEGEKD
ncbi:MAG: DUF1820 family protein [Spirochaetales bacterium]|nr:DUF1820 family protein [Spirochaetales bacterium]